MHDAATAGHGYLRDGSSPMVLHASRKRGSAAEPAARVDEQLTPLAFRHRHDQHTRRHHSCHFSEAHHEACNEFGR